MHSPLPSTVPCVFFSSDFFSSSHLLPSHYDSRPPSQRELRSRVTWRALFPPPHYYGTCLRFCRETNSTFSFLVYSRRTVASSLENTRTKADMRNDNNLPHPCYYGLYELPALVRKDLARKTYSTINHIETVERHLPRSTQPNENQAKN